MAKFTNVIQETGFKFGRFIGFFQLQKNLPIEKLNWWMGLLISIKMWLSEQKPDMFALKLKFILLPQLIATLNNYACSLPPLANVDWPAFPECFLPTM